MSGQPKEPVEPGAEPGTGANKPAVEEGLTFEQAHQELEDIVRTLERGEASLEKTLELWERGELLHAMCEARLDAAEGRIEELTRELEGDAGESPGSTGDDC